ncbi:MAG: hypothetical protein ACPGU6_03145 [Tenacibaculum sp.]
MNLLIFLKNNSDWIGVAIINTLALAIIIVIKNFIQSRKIKNSEEYKFVKKISNSNEKLSEIYIQKNKKKIIDEKYLNKKEKEVLKKRETDIIEYHLKSNKDYLELKKLFSMNIIDSDAFNESVAKIKKNIRKKEVLNITEISLNNGEIIEISKKYKDTLIDGKVLNFDIYEETIEISNKIYVIENNIIKKKLFKKEYIRSGKKLTIGQIHKHKISLGDIISNKKNLSLPINKLIILNIYFAIIVNEKFEIVKAYKIWKGNTLLNRKIEIYQKLVEISTNDLVFINNKKAKNGLYFLHTLGKIIKVKNGKII